MTRVKIVYNSFHGRYGDNPRAVYERLATIPGQEHVWLAHDEHLAGFPPGVDTVDIDSPRAAQALESADLVIANTHTELEWDKSPGTVYLQTWHGTPMKRIHHDVHWAPPGRLARLDRDVARWDLLLSPNAPSTPRLREAFRFTGEVVESGYPRNDVLAARGGGRRRRKARALLGLDDAATVVLYAPTWRDDEYFSDSSDPGPLPLDVEHLARRLGPDHVLLVRTHTMMTGRVVVPEGSQVRDVSYVSDIRDLHLAADVLVTDYSSAMFDFAVTGRPMVFYAPDLERFRDSIRGFYFDLEPVAPGPVVDDPDDVAHALSDLPALQRRYAERYDAFRRTFCHLEDGMATERVVRHLRLSGRRAGQLTSQRGSLVTTRSSSTDPW
jgi:CDP-glycerol glycerophosphotransferase